MAATAIDAIFFDIDDTLISTTEFARSAREEAISHMIRYGLKVPQEEALSELYEVINEFTSNYSQHFDKLLLRFPEKTWKGVNPAILVAAGVMGYHKTKSRELKPFADVVEIFDILSRTPLIMGVISAGLAIKQAEKLLRLDLYKYINPQAIFISDQIGISKPNVKLYRKACDILELEPSRVVYVGDHPVKDIDPANQVGMITVRSLRKSKHRDLSGVSEPDYSIHDFHELLAILRNDFGIQTGPDSSDE